MKKIFAFVLSFFLISISLFAQQTANLQGVYLAKQGDTNVLWLLADGYFSQVHYKDKQYVGTLGGPYTYDGKNMQLKIEYNDADSEAVGSEKMLQISKEGNNLRHESLLFSKQPAKKQGLDGLWHITGRKQGDDIVKIHQSGTRKTIKLLVDGYFQWMAIDPGAKTFSGTGGGHYSFKDGKYSEHIQFFSRDNSRVGAHLTFDGKLENGEWHHSGLSSKGDPIYEIWSKVK